MCNRCIDVSMNVTLGAISSILRVDREAEFHRALLSEGELKDMGSKAWLAADGTSPSWMYDMADYEQSC